MANRERELKTALSVKEEIEDRLAKLEKMRSKKYLNDEIYGSLKDEYATIKDRSDYLTTNLEELKFSQRINQDQYNDLKTEYALINESATKLLANKSEAHISEEQYEDLRKEYIKKQSDSFMIIAGIKADIKQTLDNAENELKTYNKEIDKIVIKFNIGDLKKNEYIKLQRQYQNKVEKLKKTIPELKKLVGAELSNDIVGITPTPSFNAVSMITSRDNIPKNFPVLGLSGGFMAFVSGLIERYRELSPLFKILAGLLTASLLSIIWIVAWGALGTVLEYRAILSGSEVGLNLIILIISLIEYIGAILIEIIGIIMIIYGVRDLWQERKI
jgi:hypothetical protein